MKRFIAFCLVFLMNVALQSLDSAPEPDAEPAAEAAVEPAKSGPHPVGPVALSR